MKYTNEGFSLVEFVERATTIQFWNRRLDGCNNNNNSNNNNNNDNNNTNNNNNNKDKQRAAPNRPRLRLVWSIVACMLIMWDMSPAIFDCWGWCFLFVCLFLRTQLAVSENVIQHTHVLYVYIYMCVYYNKNKKYKRQRRQRAKLW